ncbi:C-terminal binding protein [Paenarthrobacter nicotinovorans]|uniref:C-terminal binding protein n=1 Tax=Paenarthrobacter nicotinovorans TaxID=29320 RepID=UPI003D67232E
MKALITNPAVNADPGWAKPLLDIADIVTVSDLSRGTLLAEARNADALIVAVEKIDQELIESMEHCKLIHRCGIGVDVVDIPAATRAGIQVTNVPDANYKEVAAHALAMIFALSRRLNQWDATLKAGGYDTTGVGPTIHRPESQQLGILGLGKIGKIVAKVGLAAGYKVVGFDPFVDAAKAAELGVQLASLEEVIATSNILTLHTPLTPENYHFIDAEAIATMPAGATIVNVSRGGLIDEDALAQALIDGHLSGAGIDTFEREPPAPDNPLRTLPNVLLSPHAAHWSVEAMRETMEKSFAEVARVFKNEAPINPVNHLD